MKRVEGRESAYSQSQSSIKEFQVGLSDFSAEFGRAAGGTVNAVTKSGTNELHGEAFYFLRDDAFQAREPTLFGNRPAGSTAPLGPPLKNNDDGINSGLRSAGLS